MNQIRHNNTVYKHGDYVLVKVQHQLVLDAKIHITSTGRTYICHNNKSLDGCNCPDKFGYLYSWSFNIISSNTDVELIDNLSTSKTHFKASIGTLLTIYTPLCIIDNLYHFIMRQNSLSDYSIREVSDKRGMIKLQNKDGRIMEMKFGRFLKVSDIDNELTNIMIEKLTNDYISQQEGSKIKIEYLSGDRFKEGYIKDNQICASSLSESCMNGKPQLLDMYSENPEVISLLVVKNNDKIIGRSILWNINDNVKYIDKSYVSFDWVDNIIKKEINKKNYLTILESETSIKLNKFSFEKFPYLDTFRYFDDQNGVLCNYKTSTSNKYLESTSGNYSPINR